MPAASQQATLDTEHSSFRHTRCGLHRQHRRRNWAKLYDRSLSLDQRRRMAMLAGHHGVHPNCLGVSAGSCAHPAETEATHSKEDLVRDVLSLAACSAVVSAKVEVLATVLRTGRTPRADSQGNTLLHVAARCGQLSSLRWLLQHTIIPLEARNAQGETVCHVAAAHGHLECVQELVRHSHDRQRQDRHSQDMEIKDRHSQDKHSHDRHSHERHSQDRHSQDMEIKDRHSQDRHSQDMKIKDRHSQDRHSQDRHSQDRHSQDMEIKDRHSQDRHSQDRHSQDMEIKDRHSHDRHSQDRHSHERHSQDRESKHRHSQDMEIKDRHSQDRHSQDRHSQDMGPQALVTRQDNLGLTSLHHATLGGHDHVVQWLLSQFGSDLCLIKSRDGLLPTHLAAAAGNLPVLEMLLDKCKQSADIPDSSGASPAYYACQRGQLQCLRLLVERAGAELPASGLREATRGHHSHVIHYLLHHSRPDLVTMTTKLGSSALHHATDRGRQTMTQELQDVGLGQAGPDTTIGCIRHHGLHPGHAPCPPLLPPAGLSVPPSTSHRERPRSLDNGQLHCVTLTSQHAHSLCCSHWQPKLGRRGYRGGGAAAQRGAWPHCQQHHTCSAQPRGALAERKALQRMGQYESALHSCPHASHELQGELLAAMKNPGPQSVPMWPSWHRSLTSRRPSSRGATRGIFRGEFILLRSSPPGTLAVRERRAGLPQNGYLYAQRNRPCPISLPLQRNECPTRIHQVEAEEELDIDDIDRFNCRAPLHVIQECNGFRQGSRDLSLSLADIQEEEEEGETVFSHTLPMFHKALQLHARRRQVAQQQARADCLRRQRGCREDGGGRLPGIEERTDRPPSPTVDYSSDESGISAHSDTEDKTEEMLSSCDESQDRKRMSFASSDSAIRDSDSLGSDAESGRGSDCPTQPRPPGPRRAPSQSSSDGHVSDDVFTYRPTTIVNFIPAPPVPSVPLPPRDRPTRYTKRQVRQESMPRKWSTSSSEDDVTMATMRAFANGRQDALTARPGGGGGKAKAGNSPALSKTTATLPPPTNDANPMPSHAADVTSPAESENCSREQMEENPYTEILPDITKAAQEHHSDAEGGEEPEERETTRDRQGPQEDLRQDAEAAGSLSSGSGMGLGDILHQSISNGTFSKRSALQSGEPPCLAHSVTAVFSSASIDRKAYKQAGQRYLASLEDCQNSQHCEKECTQDEHAQEPHEDHADSKSGKGGCKIRALQSLLMKQSLPFGMPALASGARSYSTSGGQPAESPASPAGEPASRPLETKATKHVTVNSRASCKPRPSFSSAAPLNLPSRPLSPLPPPPAYSDEDEPPPPPPPTMMEELELGDVNLPPPPPPLPSATLPRSRRPGEREVGAGLGMAVRATTMTLTHRRSPHNLGAEAECRLDEETRSRIASLRSILESKSGSSSSSAPRYSQPARGLKH